MFISIHISDVVKKAERMINSLNIQKFNKNYEKFFQRLIENVQNIQFDFSFRNFEYIIDSSMYMSILRLFMNYLEDDVKFVLQ